jgi:hypothetical protein
MAVLAALKHQSSRLPHLERELRRDQAVGAASNPVGTEIFAVHMSPSVFKVFQPSGKKPRTPAIASDDSAYKAFVPKMVSKNMMNHYREPSGADSLSHCYVRKYVQIRTSGQRQR